jgi:hypothetical protein
MLAHGTQDRGFEPGRSRRIFHANNPQHTSIGGEVKSQICHMLKNPVIYMEIGIERQIDQPFLTHNSVLH